MALLQIAEPGQSAAPHQHRLAAGIDLGTTNSLIATVMSAVPKVLVDHEGRVLLPSVVRYGDDPEVAPVVGAEALAAQGADHLNTIASVKRLMGRTLADVMKAATFAVAKNATSKTYLQGMSQVFDAIADPDRYGDSLVLGGGEVKLVDLTSAYAVMANQGTAAVATQNSNGTYTTSTPILEVRDLRTQFNTLDGVVRAVDGVSFDLARGETLGIVGESGCGKTITALAIMRLLQTPPVRIVAGAIRLDGTDLLSLDAEDLRAVRGNRIGMIFQEPMTSLNLVFTVGDQIAEVIMATNPTLEGEATAMYLGERLEGKVGSVTRIARGLPVGGDLEYADDVTLIRALQGRRAL